MKKVFKRSFHLISSSKKVKLFFSSILLLYVFQKSGLFTVEGWVDLVEVLADSNPYFLLISFLLIFIMEAVNAFKWYCLSKPMAFNNSFSELYRYCLVGRFYNLVLPSNVGGDLIRIKLQGSHSGEYIKSAAIIFVERLTGIITLVTISALVLITHQKSSQIPYVEMAVFFTGGAVFILVCLVFFDKPFRLFTAVFQNKFPLVDKALAKAVKFRNSVLCFKGHPGPIYISFFNSLIFYAFAIFSGWVAVSVFEGQVLISDMILAIPLIMILLNLPISIGGIGLLEFSNVVVLSFFGISPTVALSVALLVRIKTFIAAGIGYVFSNLELTEKVASAD